MIKLLHVALSHGDNGLTRALKRVCDEYAEIPTSHPDLNGQICHVLDSFQPTIVWIQIQSEGLTEQSLVKLRDSSAYVINWTGDVRKPIPDFYWFYGQYVDITCFSNMHDVRIFRKYGYKADYLQIGFDPEIYKPEGEKKQVPDIVFMGNNTRQFLLSLYRAKMVGFLKDHYGSNFGVYGSGWGGIESGNYMGDQYGEAAVYRGAKIGINCSHFDFERYSSDRLFRMLGCGICVLSHRYNGIEKDFIDGRELVGWDDFDDLKKQINWLLERPDNIKMVGKLGFEVAKNNFTFDSMCENIIKIYNAR